MKIKKLKVMTIIGTRPEIIRLSRVIKKLHETTEHFLVHTGQNYDYELNEIFFKDLEIPVPQYFLDAATNSHSAAETVGNIIAKSYDLLKSIKPDVVLILGDTNSCLSAYSAKRLKIPVFHMEAGNRCFDQRVPEEINRKIVDHISDINLCYSDLARQNLIKEGLSLDRCIKTGSPMKEVLHYSKNLFQNSKILSELKLEKNNYLLVSIHREENIELNNATKKFCDILNKLAVFYQLPIIVSTHPRTRKSIDAIGIKLDPLISLCKPFSFSDYINLQINSFVVLSDSGTITEEASILNFPALNIREAHERLEGMDEGAVVMTGMNLERIMQGIELVKNQSRFDIRSEVTIPKDYDCINVSEKVVRILHSYCDYVNLNVWKTFLTKD